MRFGIIDHNDDTGRPHTRQVAERLELIEAYDRLGFYAYHLTEHHGTPLAVTPSPHLMLAAAAQRTSRLRLGTLITILSLYHPMRVIEEAVTLDQLSGGRLDLGVGRGVSQAERTLTDAYKAEWASLGRPADDLPPLGISRNMVLAPTSEEAMKIANRAFARFKDSLYFLWKKYDIPIPPVFPAETFEGIHATGHFYAGDPAGAREWVARHRDIGGINYMALETWFGDMTIAEALQSAELLATEVMPHFA